MADLSVEIAGVRFKNSVWVSSSEVTEDFNKMKRSIDMGAGAVVAKSYTANPAVRKQTDLAKYVSPVGKDLLVFHIQTTEPVQWHLRAGMQFSDIPDVLKGMLLNLPVLLMTIRAIFFLKKKPKEPEEF